MMYAVGKLETAINIISHYICYYLLSNIYKSIGSVPEQFVVQSVDVVEPPHLSKGQLFGGSFLCRYLVLGDLTEVVVHTVLRGLATRTHHGIGHREV